MNCFWQWFPSKHNFDNFSLLPLKISLLAFGNEHLKSLNLAVLVWELQKVVCCLSGFAHCHLVLTGQRYLEEAIMWPRSGAGVAAVWWYKVVHSCSATWEHFVILSGRASWLSEGGKSLNINSTNSTINSQLHSGDDKTTAGDFSEFKNFSQHRSQVLDFFWRMQYWMHWVLLQSEQSNYNIVHQGF